MRNLRSLPLWMGLSTLALLPGQALADSIVVPLTGEQELPDPVVTDALGTALLDFNPSSNAITVETQVFGIDQADLFDIPMVGPFHLHIEMEDGVGPVAISFGPASSWVQHLDGITLSALGTNVGAFSPEEVAAALFAGTTYLNLHTQAFPGGELRGDVAAIPEPGTAILLGVGLLGLVRLGRVANGSCVSKPSGGRLRGDPV